MPKKIKYLIKDSTTIILDEDAMRNDYVDLTDSASIDRQYIIEQIEKTKQDYFSKELEKKENEFKNRLKEKEMEFLAKIEDIKDKTKLESLRQTDNEKYELNKKITELENNITLIKSEQEFVILKAVNDQINKLREEKDKVILSLNDELTTFKEKVHFLELEKKNALLQQKLDLDKDFSAKIKTFNKQIDELNFKNQELIRSRESLNIKLLGENLETWCYNEVINHINSGGFPNATFQKDNKLVKGDDRPTKGDYTFRVYTDSNHTTEIASVCLDMKSKLPNTEGEKNKTKFKKLSSDTIKKKCTYGVLVSELEMNIDNYSLFYNDTEYKNLYMIRPAYLVFFLQIVYKLAIQYADIITAKEIEKINFKSQEEISKMFEEFSENILTKQINKIIKNAEIALTHIKNTIDSAEKAKNAIEKEVLDSCEKLNTDKSKFRLDLFIKKINKHNEQ